MRLLPAPLPDIKILQPQILGDERGWFAETFRADWFRTHVCDCTFVQENHSRSAAGVLRGLHYQSANPQGKLVRVIRGAVFDVAVDLRKNSPDFGRWCGTVLSAENRLQQWIPPGFAHGFCVLGEGAEFVYQCTDYYNPHAEHTLLWNDPTLGIDWPLAGRPILSAKDRVGTPFAQAVCFD